MRLSGGSRCFPLFFQKFTASDISFAAEILNFQGIERRNNSKPPAVFCCFCEQKHPKSQRRF